jgi:8-oxo-dGTP diphosphatase
MEERKIINVVAAVIVIDGEYLCVQRADSKHKYISRKYEFPGGKIEKNESEVSALKREIQEELSMDIEVNKKYLTVHHEYPDFSISMDTYLCSCRSKNLILHEHVDYKWLNKADLNQLDWAAADIPIVNKLMAG